MARLTPKHILDDKETEATNIMIPSRMRLKMEVVRRNAIEGKRTSMRDIVLASLNEYLSRFDEYGKPIGGAVVSQQEPQANVTLPPVAAPQALEMEESESEEETYDFGSEHDAAAKELADNLEEKKRKAKRLRDKRAREAAEEAERMAEADRRPPPPKDWNRIDEVPTWSAEDDDDSGDEQPEPEQQDDEEEPQAPAATQSVTDLF